MRVKNVFFIACLTLVLSCVIAVAETGKGFVPLFDGKTFEGWKFINQAGKGYGITNNAIYCVARSGSNLLTEKTYSDFVLRFEFKLGPGGGNNGVGIRVPLQGKAAYDGLEIQVINDTTTNYGKLRPEQHHGAIYDVVAPKIGFQKPAGEWNSQEITANGPLIKVVLNGHTIVQTNISKITDPAVVARHPGLRAREGHIGFLGHSDYVEFRNIRIKELPGKKE